jgi:hypothetical protein
MTVSVERNTIFGAYITLHLKDNPSTWLTIVPHGKLNTALT